MESRQRTMDTRPRKETTIIQPALSSSSKEKAKTDHDMSFPFVFLNSFLFLVSYFFPGLLSFVCWPSVLPTTSSHLMSLVLLASGFRCPQTGKRPSTTGQTDNIDHQLSMLLGRAGIRARPGMDLSDTTGFAARTCTLGPRKLSSVYPASLKYMLASFIGIRAALGRLGVTTRPLDH